MEYILKNNVAALIPFYSSRKNIDQDVIILNQIIASLKKIAALIVIVDDGTKIQPIPGVVLQKHKVNKGKGASIRTGLKKILESKSINYIVECDCDNDQDPGEAHKFIEYLRTKDLFAPQLILGNRYTAIQMQKPGTYRESMNIIQKLIFKELGLNIIDSVSGFRAYNRLMAEAILTKTKSIGFGIATEELIVACAQSANVQEIPLTYAKPRKHFTQAYKLTEVLNGILVHTSFLRSRHKGLLSILSLIKHKIDNKDDLIKLDFSSLGGNLYTMKRIKDSYTIIGGGSNAQKKKR